MNKYPESEISHLFTYHNPPDEKRIAAHNMVNAYMASCALKLSRILPDCETSRDVIKTLQMARMQANCAIACFGTDPAWETPEPMKTEPTPDEKPGEAAPNAG